MYQRVGKAAYKANLDNTWALAELTGHPEKTFRSIHIAGTNGKGSTAHMLSSIFQEAGYKTGLYTSPHLIDFRERIKINGQMIPKESVVSFYESYHEHWQKIQPSFFEITVLMAFDYFRAENVDIAIIETGLGGRLDSTNIVLPEISVITNIGLDHTQFLGSTIEKIAFEKAGIIKKNTPVVLGKMLPKAAEVIKRRAKHLSAKTYLSELTTHSSELKGEFQKENISTVCAAIKIIQKQREYYITEPHIKAGLQNIKANTGLRGRYDEIETNPKVILDGAHNSGGIKTLLSELEKESFKKLHIVWSMVSDKDALEVFNILPLNASYYFCQSSVPRAMPVEKLKALATKFEFSACYFPAVEAALEQAKSNAEPSDLILVTGSFFTVADALKSIEL